MAVIDSPDSFDTVDGVPFGKSQTKEHRLKISKAKKRYWEKIKNG